MVRTMSATRLSTFEADPYQNRNKDSNLQCNLFDRHKEKQIDSELRMTIEPQRDMNQNIENECESNLNHDEASVFGEATTKSSSVLSSFKYHVTSLPPKCAATDSNDIENDHLFESDLSVDDINENTISTDIIPSDISEIHVADIQYDEEPETNTLYQVHHDSTISSTNTTTTGCQRATLLRDSITSFDDIIRFGTLLIINEPTECALYSLNDVLIFQIPIRFSDGNVQRECPFAVNVD